MDVYRECYFFVENAVEGGEAGGVDSGGGDCFGGLGACHEWNRWVGMWDKWVGMW